MRIVHFTFYSCIIEQVVNDIHFSSGWRGQRIESEAGMSLEPPFASLWEGEK
jgi:hypothetical protein